MLFLLPFWLPVFYYNLLPAAGDNYLLLFAPAQGSDYINWHYYPNTPLALAG